MGLAATVAGAAVVLALPVQPDMMITASLVLIWMIMKNWSYVDNFSMRMS